MNTQVNIGVTFSRRATKKETETAFQRRWTSDCGRYAVVESRSKFGLTTHFIAIAIGENGEVAFNNRTKTKVGCIKKCNEREAKR